MEKLDFYGKDDFYGKKNVFLEKAEFMEKVDIRGKSCFSCPSVNSKGIHNEDNHEFKISWPSPIKSVSSGLMSV